MYLYTITDIFLPMIYLGLGTWLIKHHNPFVNMQKNDYNIMLIIWLSKYDLDKELVISCRPVQDIHSTSGTMHSHDILTQFI